MGLQWIAGGDLTGYQERPLHLRIGGNDLRPVLLEPNGSVVFEIAMGEPKAVHPLWWGPGDYYLYDLEMQLPGASTWPAALIEALLCLLG